jgi:hypothetical protein
MIATAIPDSSSPLKAMDTNLKGGTHACAMADFTFAIVVSLASPIQPGRDVKTDAEDTLRR